MLVVSLIDRAWIADFAVLEVDVILVDVFDHLHLWFRRERALVRWLVLHGLVPLIKRPVYHPILGHVLSPEFAVV